MTRRDPTLLAVVLAVAGVIALSLWLVSDGTAGFVRRVPGMDDRPPPEDPSDLPPLVGVLTTGEGTPGTAPGSSLSPPAWMALRLVMSNPPPGLAG